MKFADLHIHSFFSDGTCSPRSLVRQAKEAGLQAISLTDHDSVEGIAETMREGEAAGIEVVPGIELTAQFNGSEAHILGYFIDHTDPGLLERLELLKQDRVRRVYEISDKLKAMKVDLDPKLVFELSDKGTVGRLHVARALLKHGFVRSIMEAFDRFIGDRRPAYVAHYKFSPAEAIGLIRSNKGIAVLAHPYSFNHDEAIPELAKLGLQGIEVYYPEHSERVRKFYSGIADTLGLLMTGGSDYHGEGKPDISLGCAQLPYEYLEKLKASRKQQ